MPTRSRVTAAKANCRSYCSARSNDAKHRAKLHCLCGEVQFTSHLEGFPRIIINLSLCRAAQFLEGGHEKSLSRRSRRCRSRKRRERKRSGLSVATYQHERAVRGRRTDGHDHAHRGPAHVNAAPPPKTRPLTANPRECRRFSHTWKSHRGDRTGWLGWEDSNLGIAVDMMDNARALPTCSRRSSQACCDATTKVPDLMKTQCRHDQSMCHGGSPISARVMRIGAHSTGF